MDNICLQLEYLGTQEEYKEMGKLLMKSNEVIENLQFNKSIRESIKQTLLEKFNSQMQEITNKFINNNFPDEYRDSIFLIERTLAEPELCCSLPKLLNRLM